MACDPCLVIGTLRRWVHVLYEGRETTCVVGGAAVAILFVIGAVVVDPAILVVDDNEDNRLTLRMRLESCGYTNIVEATNGREALEKMRAGPVDIVLLDIMMP